ALVVTAAHAGAAVATDGVDLVDEDDGGRVLLGLLEEVANTARTATDEHLDEVGAGDGVERHPRLAGDRAREQGLAGARRTVEEHALGDLGADGLELGRLLEELLDLAELLDRLVRAGDIAERRLRHVLGDQLGARLRELHDAATASALHLVHQEQEQQHDQHERQQRGHDLGDHARVADLHVGRIGRQVALVDLRLDLVGQLRLGAVEPVGGDLAALRPDVRLEGGLDGLVTTVDQRDLLDLPGGDVAVHLTGGDLVVAARRSDVLQEEQHAEDRDDQPQRDASHQTLHRTLSTTTLPTRTRQGDTEIRE